MQLESLFEPFKLKSLQTKNRFVMAPMTRSCSPNGIPTADVAHYYSKRALADVGLIISEGTTIHRPAPANDPNVPKFEGDEALAGWQAVIESVKNAGGQMAPQLWHAGIQENHASGWLPETPFEGPSGIGNGREMDHSAIADTIEAYGKAALHAKNMGFNCVEIQAGHGYLIDQFFDERSNKRNDCFGGQTLAERSRFAVEVVKEIRRRTGSDFALGMRISQWKFTDYNHKMAKSPQELEAWLAPLANAGIDIFHCSTRRFWEPEFAGSDLNLAGWAKKLTGKATITVGSVGLDKDVTSLYIGQNSSPSSLDELERRMDNKEFDLVAVGRALLTDPYWVQKIRANQTSQLLGFNKEALCHLA